jgi:hypothetical protein
MLLILKQNFKHQMKNGIKSFHDVFMWRYLLNNLTKINYAKAITLKPDGCKSPSNDKKIPFWSHRTAKIITPR